MNILFPILTITGIQLLAVISPGPNFLIALKHGLSQPRRKSLFTTTGIATGSFIHVVLGFLGLSIIIAKSALLYHALKYCGSAYLLYLGIKAFWIKSVPINVNQLETAPPMPLSDKKSFTTGLFVCLSNPKAAIYYLVLFTSIIPPNMPFWAKLIMILILPLIAWGWYSSLVLLISRKQFADLYLRFSRPFEMAFGLLLILLGIKILVSTI